MWPAILQICGLKLMPTFGNYQHFDLPVLARQPSWVVESLLRFSWGRGGNPLVILASRKWGPTYTVFKLSDIHTLGSWVDFFMKFYSC